MAPDRRGPIRRAASEHSARTEPRFVRTISSHSAGVMVSIGARFQMPWFATRTSSGPRASSAAATRLSAAPAAARSARSVTAVDPAASTSAAASRAAFSSRA
jgi:hypothetical protein